ncbi:MAG: AAA family ATPase, partial [Deltaproteobacteria bacterium]|nr:AAA family ATPase [Deltaproteobacteria bacterium]
MYLSHFNLTRDPFALTPDPRFLFMSDRHREALAHLLYGLGERGGFVQLTGEVGTGKTTLCRSLLDQVPEGVDVALILNPRLTALELVSSICDELLIPWPAGTQSLKVLVDLLNRHLLDAHARGRRTVLVIDEAQQLSADVLEQVRLLTNLETATAKLLQIVLIGQPELQPLMARSDLRQL